MKRNESVENDFFFKGAIYLNRKTILFLAYPLTFASLNPDL